MADGYAQASGRPTLVNLHTAPGVGNAMGAIFNAQANKSPLLVTAGQQARSLMTLQANLTNRDATRMPHPLVKWSYEPPRAEDVPHAIARGATYLASLPPKGPAFVSIPMDDWDAEVDEAAVAHQTARTVDGRAARRPRRRARVAARLAGRRSPCSSPGPDLDASGGWDAAVALAERLRLPVWATPAPGGGRIGFPEGHPRFRASCRRRSGRSARRSRAVRPRARRGLVGVPVLPEHPRAAAARRRLARRDHLRPRRGGPRADGRRDRRRPGARARGAARPSVGDRPTASRRPRGRRRRRSSSPTR